VVVDPTIEVVLRHLPSSLSTIDARGQTPLHIAASLSRTDVVALLLNQPKIDDMIRDSNGRTCREVGGAEVAGLISGESPGAHTRRMVLMKD
jgi:ankyrin repeat protein